MDREILVKAMVETYSPTELATKLVECEEDLRCSSENTRERDIELMSLRETNYLLKEIITKLTERADKCDTK